MERFGLVGLPNAGKSSLYNALTGGGALAAPYPFATKDPNIGVAKVPDDRLDRLAAMSKSRNVVHAAVQVVDIGGLVEGASKGEGLGNKFLANIREVDAVVFVLRAFVDDDVTGPSDPIEHLRIVELELALADLEALGLAALPDASLALEARRMRAQALCDCGRWEEGIAALRELAGTSGRGGEREGLLDQAQRCAFEREAYGRPVAWPGDLPPWK